MRAYEIEWRTHLRNVIPSTGAPSHSLRWNDNFTLPCSLASRITIMGREKDYNFPSVCWMKNSVHVLAGKTSLSRKKMPWEKEGNRGSWERRDPGWVKDRVGCDVTGSTKEDRYPAGCRVASLPRYASAIAVYSCVNFTYFIWGQILPPIHRNLFVEFR